MSIPIPAETPDPNIDTPTIPPTEPEPVPEQEPPGTTPPPREDPPETMPPVIVAPSPQMRSPSGLVFLAVPVEQLHDLRHHAKDRQRQQRTEHRRRFTSQPG